MSSSLSTQQRNKIEQEQALRTIIGTLEQKEFHELNTSEFTKTYKAAGMEDEFIACLIRIRNFHIEQMRIIRSAATHKLANL